MSSPPHYNTPEEMNEAIKKYWEQEETVSIIDKNLHRIEMDTVLSHLLPGDTIADIGCGEGVATAEYGGKVKRVQAFERSDTLRAKAARRFADLGLKNVTVEPGDVLTLTGHDGAFDAIVSQRMLINLPDWETQQKGILNLHRMLKPGGRLIMVENTDDAFAAMNAMRTEMDLRPIPQHWHNIFFDYDKLKPFMERRFETVREYDFALYYFLTRVYVPMFASFTGFGLNAKKDPIFDLSDAAARRAFEAFGDKVKFDVGRALGPIQCFVYKKK